MWNIFQFLDTPIVTASQLKVVQPNGIYTLDLFLDIAPLF